MNDYNSYVSVGTLIGKINSIKGKNFFSDSIKNGRLPVLSGHDFNFVPYITKDGRILSESLLNSVICFPTIKRCKEYARQIGWHEIAIVEDTKMTKEKFDSLLDKYESEISSAVLEKYNLIVIYYDASFYIKRYSPDYETFIIERFDSLKQVKDKAKTLKYRKLTIISDGYTVRHNCHTMDLTPDETKYAISQRPIDGPNLFKLVENIRGEKTRMDKSILNCAITVDKVSFTPIGEFIAMLNITF